MKAVTFAGHRTVAYESVEDPCIEDARDAIVRVQLSAICGSDMHPYNGREEGLDPGTIMGHEFVGEVVELGEEVSSVRVGDSVYSPFTTSCGECFYCTSGLSSRCPRGQLFGWIGDGEGLHGGQAELVRVPLADTTLLPVPEGISAEQALLLGDIFSTAYFCAEMASAGPGRVFALVGCGPVGILTVAAARHLGAEIIYAVDKVSERLELAHRFGAVPLNYTREDPVEALHEATEGRGADAVMEAVGSFAAARAAIELVRPGGVISTVGVHTDEKMAFSPTEAYDKNLTYRVGRCPARDYMLRLAPVVREELDVDITDIVSHRLPLSDAPAAYRMFDERRDGCMKVVLEP